MESAKVIAEKGMEYIRTGKVRDHKLGNSARVHSGAAENREYHIFRRFLPTKNNYIVTNLTGTNWYE